MNCQDVREGISTETGLTEWALVHAHLIQCAECRTERERLRQSSRQRPGLPRFGAWLRPRLRAFPSTALTTRGQAVARMVEAARAELAPTLLARPRRAVAASTGCARSLLTRGAGLVIGLRSSSTRVRQWAGRSATQAARVGRSASTEMARVARSSSTVGLRWAVRSATGAAHVTRSPSTIVLRLTTRSALMAAHAGRTGALASLARLREWSSIAFTGTAAAGGRLIAASRVGATRLLDLLNQARRPLAALFVLPERAAGKAIEATRAAGQIVVTASHRARPFLKVGVAVASLAVLVAVTVLVLPRQWLDDAVPWFSASRQLDPQARRPVDPEPVTLATPPRPVKAPPPATVAVSRPAAAPELMRSTPPEVPARIPASPSRPDPAPVRVRAAASAEPGDTAEAPDPSAAIDWLLKGGGGRGR